MAAALTGVTLSEYGKFVVVATTGVGDVAVAGGAGGGSAVVSVTNDCGRLSVAPLRVSGDATGIVTEPM